MLSLGELDVWAVSDGQFALDGGAMFGIVPKPLWSRQILADESNRIPMALRCLLIRVADRLILVDAGIGDRWSDREREIYCIDRSAGGIERALLSIGFRTAQITDIIVTHLHFDHVGGLVRVAADGSLVPTFPQATHHVQRRHLKWAEHASDKDRGSFRADDIAPIVRTGRLHLLDGDTDLFAGVEVLVSEGHTVAQQLVRLRGGGETLLHCADVVPTAAHVHLPWVMGYDLYPLTTIEEKKTILAQAVEGSWTLFFEHDPELAACRVREDEGRVVVGETVSL